MVICGYVSRNDMNRLFLTASHPKVYTSLPEILSEWHDGVSFRVYQGYYTSIEDKVKMQLSGFTHVCFVWQDINLNTRHYDLEI